MTDLDGDALDALQTHLEANAVGRDNAIVSDDLADVIDEQDAHDTNPSVREACRALLAERGVPVQGGPTGFYIVQPGAEAEAAIESIREQIGALNTRKIHLEDALESYDYTTDDADPTPDTTCEACGGAIAGDPWLWFSYELCHDCHEAAPGMSGPTDEFVENGGADA